jgi:non-haem Fe2+, alpha-ketoglutarate-dependent halogenase
MPGFAIAAECHATQPKARGGQRWLRGHAYGKLAAMTGSLSPAQRCSYRQHGYASPLPALTAAEAQSYLDRLAAFEARSGQAAGRTIRLKGHLKLMMLYDLVFHPGILDAVESFIGPDILCWGSTLFIKEPGDDGIIAWHQDGYYFDLEGDDVVSAWIALAPSTAANGVVRVVPGSHAGPCHPHRISSDDSANAITSHEEIAVDVNEAASVPLFLAQGEMSLHHPKLIHGSGPNRDMARRCGYAIRYVAPHVRHRHSQPTATLVRGNDHYGHFGPDPVPRCDMDPDIVAFVDTPP